MENIDIYGISKQLNRFLELIKKSEEITPNNKEAIVKFQDACFSEGLTETRVLFYVCRLYQIARWIKKDFKDASKEDIQKLMGEIERSEYSVNTKNIYRVVFKKFYKWLEGNGEEYPLKVKWIKTTLRGNNNKLPEELLTQEDIKKLIDACNHPRDKALISLLYESGCRVGEIATLRIKNCSFDKYGAQLIVSGKTGMRRVRIIASLYYLTNWLENHPDKKNPEAPLWITLSNRNQVKKEYWDKWKAENKGKIAKLSGYKLKKLRRDTLREAIKSGEIKELYKPSRYVDIRKRLQDIAIESGIKKAVNPHIFRHSRATYLAGKLTEAQMNEFFGWKQGSDMPSTYVHLSGRDVDSALLQVYGIKTKEESKDEIICARCMKVNDALARYCKDCGAPLTLSVALELEDKKKKIDDKMTMILEALDYEEVKEIIAKKIYASRFGKEIEHSQ